MQLFTRIVSRGEDMVSKCMSFKIITFNLPTCIITYNILSHSVGKDAPPVSKNKVKYSDSVLLFLLAINDITNCVGTLI